MARSAYGPKTRHPTVNNSTGKAKQSFKKECDINHIMAKYQKTGAITHLNENAAQYGFATSLDFRESLDLVRSAQDLFDGLPSKIRRRFANNPAEFLAFCEDPANRSEAAVLGLLTPEATAALAVDSDSATAPTPPSPAEPPTPD